MANSAEHDNEIWYSDGTEEGTSLIIGGTPNLETSTTSLLGVINGRVLVPLRANDDSVALYAQSPTPPSRSSS